MIERSSSAQAQARVSIEMRREGNTVASLLVDLMASLGAMSEFDQGNIEKITEMLDTFAVSVGLPTIGASEYVDEAENGPIRFWRAVADTREIEHDGIPDDEKETTHA